MDGCAAVTTITATDAKNIGVWDVYTGWSTKHAILPWTVAPASCKIDYVYKAESTTATLLSHTSYEGDSASSYGAYVSFDSTYNFVTAVPAELTGKMAFTAVHRAIAIPTLEVEYAFKFMDEPCEVANGMTLTPADPKVDVVVYLGQFKDQKVNVAVPGWSPTLCQPSKYKNSIISADLQLLI